MSAGTYITPSVVAHCDAMSCDAALDSMMPRSSRSHCTLVPADNMMASTPQVATPGDDGEGAAPAASVEARSIGADDDVEHAAGAEGDLGWPRSDDALAQ